MTPNPQPPRKPRSLWGVLLLAGLLGAAFVLAQEASQQSQPPPKEEKEKKAEKEKTSRRLFGGGKISLRSSRQEQDTAGHGFKGVGEDGKVQRAALSAQPGSEEYAKVAQMSGYKVPQDDLAAFLQGGGLRTRSQAKKGGS